MAGYIGSKAVNLSTTGADINGDANIDGDLSFGDNDKAIFGAGGDLEIYHSGFNSFIDEVGTGYLQIRASDNITLKSAADELYVNCVNNGAVTLYYDNAAKLATTSTGIDVTGTVTADAYALDSIALPSAGTATIFNRNTDNNLYIQTDSGNTVYLLDGSQDTMYAASPTSHIFQISNAEKMRIDSSGRVGIGTSSPTQLLQVRNSATTISSAYISAVSGVDGNAGVIFGDVDADAVGGVLYNNNENALRFFKSGFTEAARIDSSGNLLVGRTTLSGTDNTQGAYVFNEGAFVAQRSSNPSLYLNRYGTDGDIALFRKEGTNVGSIGAYSGDLYVVNAGGVGAGLRYNSGFPNILPCNGTGAARDNAIDLGASGVRFNDIYATNGTIQTSDRNEKQDIAELSDAEQRVAVAAKGLMRKFRWKDAVAEKGDDARTHFGIIAQDLQAAFAAEGLDAGDYAMFISSTWTDEETGEERTRMGVRYSELLAFIIGAL